MPLLVPLRWAYVLARLSLDRWQGHDLYYARSLFLSSSYTICTSAIAVLKRLEH